MGAEENEKTVSMPAISAKDTVQAIQEKLDDKTPTISLRQPEVGDLDHGIGLPVAVTTTHILPPPELLDDDLLGLELIDDLGDHLGAFDHGLADGCIAIAARDQENLGEDQLVTGLALAPIDPDAIALADPELMASVFDNGIHPSNHSWEDQTW